MCRCDLAAMEHGTHALRVVFGWCPALALGLASLVAVPALTVPAAGPVAAVFPPWWDAARTLGAAAAVAPVLGFGAVPFVVVLHPEGDARAPLLRAGALFLLDPAAVGCSATKRWERA